MTTSTVGQREDKLAIAEVIQNWALWRDGGNYQALRSTFHPDATMTSTWFSGPAEEFVARAESRKPGGRSAHFVGGSSVRLNGDKALAETPITLLLRETVDDVEVDVTCHGRFFDRLVRAEDRWCILRRGVIYEKDRLDPVRPDAVLKLDEAILARFPEGYRHVAYVQSKRGLVVATDRPTLPSPQLEVLYREAESWLGAHSH
jgi:SnoaL-like protein